MKVIVREAAYRDLDEIHTWIARDRPAAADRVIDRIVESTETARTLPLYRTCGQDARHPRMGRGWFALCRGLYG